MVISFPLRWVWPAQVPLILVAVVRAQDLALYQMPVAGAHVYVDIMIVCAFLLTGGVVLCLMELARLGNRLREAQQSVARLGASAERARMAQDLHDTLGYSLTAIMLQGELAERHLSASEEHAMRHLRAVQETARVALEDVRRVARASRQPRLDRALTEAVELIEAAGARCHLEVEVIPQDKQREVLAWVLREVVSNVLRHSSPTECRIRLTMPSGEYQLMVENDGVPDVVRDRAHGTGLRSLRDRLAGLGGWLEAGLRADGRFRFVAVVPAERATP
jgi:two-component system sensor histidine kinase DesK